VKNKKEFLSPTIAIAIYIDMQIMPKKGGAK